MADDTADADRSALTPAERAERRRRLARIFGEGPPTQTRDDLPEPGEREGVPDEWWRRQVPPHHG